jgi:CHAT domain-containing protein
LLSSPDLRDRLWDIARATASSAGFTFAGGCEYLLVDLIERLAADIGVDADRVPLAESYIKLLVVEMVRIAETRGMDQLHEPTFDEAVAIYGDPIARTHLLRAAGRRTRSSRAAPPPRPAPVKRNGGGAEATSPDDALLSGSQPMADSAGNTASDPPRSAFALVECPPVVVAGVEFEVRIGLSAQQSAGIVGGPLIRPPSSIGAYTLAVQVVADGFILRANETWRNTLQVTAQEAYPTFTLHLTPGEQSEDLRPGAIQAIYSVDSHTMGFAVRSVVSVRREELRPVETPREPASGTDLSIPTQLVPPDLTVRISTNTKENGGLLWTFETRFADIDVPDEAAKTNIGDHPAMFAQQLVAQLNRKEGQPDLAPYLRGVGKKIANNMPSELWDLLRAVVARTNAPPTVLLLSQEPHVPWELALVPEPRLDSKAPPFLSAQATVGRWVLSTGTKLPPPTAHEVQQIAVVWGEYKGPRFRRLVEAEQEAANLKKKYPDAIDVNADVVRVLECIEGRVEADLLHFAVHGVYDPDGVENGLALVDGKFLDPMVVSGSTLTRAPFVFLNACQVGSGSKTLGDYSGMAAAFLEAGASGVVAPLWSIKDSIAHHIALEFYEAVSAGNHPADALRRARSGFDNQAAAPSGTMLAYQFFGHPALRLVFKTP